MSSAFSLADCVSSKLSIAVMPCGTVLVGTTTTSRVASSLAACAAMMMFLLLGRTNTTSAGVCSMAFKISSVEGFMVCPPSMMPSAPRSRNTPARPAPAHTATKPNGFSGAAGCAAAASPDSSSCSMASKSSVERALRPSARSSCCMRMFSILASSSVPYFWDSARASHGMFVWTCTLNASSSSPMTRLSPMESRYTRSGSRETFSSFLRTM